MEPSAPTHRGVLVVDDDELTRTALGHVVTRLGHGPVAVAATLAEAMALLDGQAFAIIDLDLPDGSGAAILRRIRAERRPMRVAVVTGTVDDDRLAEVWEYGPDLLLRKPVNLNALLDWLGTAG